MDRTQLYGFDFETNGTMLSGNDTTSLFESSPQLECLLSAYSSEHSGSGNDCNTTWDGLSCWPTTKAATSAVIPCFKEFNGVLYDSSKNASRECYSNGTWANKSDYSSCKPLVEQDATLQVLWDVKEAATIYYFGYGLSLIALSVALFIFLHFKDLRCLRNTIHTNLMVTYLFIDLTWIITASLQSSTSADAHKAACVLVILLTYLMGTNFFWMFVEGLYLYILVVKTFSVENVKWQFYAAIGWGLPAVVVIVWTIVKAHLTHVSGEGPVAPSPVVGCPWQNRDHYDYIFVCPVLIVLLVNIFFLGQIMWVLITKLRAATSVESKQYRKAAKALLVLIPLLGVTYIVVIVTPSHRTARVIFSYAQAALLSTQGFTVAVLYCFFNGEVRKSVRHHFEQWKDSRGLARGRQGHRGSRNGDGAFRLYSNRSGVRDRNSCISLSTSGTWLGCNYKCPIGPGQKPPSNGSYSPVPMRDDCL